jgi:hypothetical protein
MQLNWRGEPFSSTIVAIGKFLMSVLRIVQKGTEECGGDEGCHSPVSCPSPARLSEAGTCLKAQGVEHGFSGQRRPFSRMCGSAFSCGFALDMSPLRSLSWTRPFARLSAG